EPDSWSRTPLVNMTGVQLIHNDKMLAIYGPGDYWQSDSFETEIVLAGSPPVRLTHRRIEKQIDKPNVARVKSDRFGLVFDFRDKEVMSSDTGMLYLPKPEEMPYWLILEFDVISNKLMWRHSKERI
ncbi:MAG TPA: hypothetical protein VKR58_03580, partial [Aquella sp.]|nr:hypothetical protein [Aquella sp.]